MLSLGKMRHLQRASGHSGRFIIAAMDHRGNLLESLRTHDGTITEEQFADFKRQLAAALIGDASGLLTDPNYGVGPAIVGQVLTGDKGLLIPVEVTDYALHASERQIQFIPNWSVGKIKRVGGDCVKLLLPFHPDASSARSRIAVVAELIEACRQYDIPFFLEPIAHSIEPGQHLSNQELLDAMVRMASLFSEMGVDVLKMAFPVHVHHEPDERVWRQACKALDDACGVPWALLSGGVSYEVFLRQAQIALECGASGVIVGRAVWSEAVQLQGMAREQFLRDVASARMHELAEVCLASGRPWYERVTMPDVDLNWLNTYADI